MFLQILKSLSLMNCNHKLFQFSKQVTVTGHWDMKIPPSIGSSYNKCKIKSICISSDRPCFAGMFGLMLFACGQEEAVQPVTLCLYISGAQGCKKQRENSHGELPGEQNPLATIRKPSLVSSPYLTTSLDSARGLGLSVCAYFGGQLMGFNIPRVTHDMTGLPTLALVLYWFSLASSKNALGYPLASPESPQPALS